MVAVTGGLAQVSETLRLDRPREALDEALGRTSPTTVPTPTSVPPTAVTTTTPRPTTTSVADAPATTAAPPTTVTIPGVFLPTPEAPAHLWVTGDSLTERFGPALVNLASETGVVDPRREVQYSTGLTRPDFFDWPAHLVSEVENQPTDILVFMVGANDGQPIQTEAGWIDFGTNEWSAEYRRRVAATMEMIAPRVPTIYWIGQPIARSSEYSEKMAVMNEIYRSEAERHTNIRYVDTWALFSDETGSYSAYLPDDSGNQVLMRAGDGIHLTYDGGDRLASVVIEVIGNDWALRG
jgi:hypothetical protein